ncbi:FtsX-like permease family protein [Catenuloplanes japonicus]|uniref:FtsX-like permease family protein n=1 Tax=Catenuloplanes japonicus TaxID=33876 RepID=UPI000525966D|nr:FtsX-like permease family protein [Catenuloplanes japonicus]
MRLLTGLALGMRMAFAGGRRGWARTALAAAGVGLGAAVLLLGASVPVMLDARSARLDGRSDGMLGTAQPARGDTALITTVYTEWDGREVFNRLIWPESDRAPLPPGLTAFPGDRQMYVSPALRTALDGPGGDLLRAQLPYQVVGTIAPVGLSGPHELAFYAGYRDLETMTGVNRVAGFGGSEDSVPRTGVYLFIVVVLAGVLIPVTILIGAALRFGADTRDRRLAAIRLAGADSRMVRRIAAGESLVLALTGLALGALLFRLVSLQAGRMVFLDISVFPSDVRPAPPLGLLAVVVVLVMSAGMTLLGLRGVEIEPLGAVRRAEVWHGRLWWRLLPLALGLLLIHPVFTGPVRDESQISLGVIVLIGALIPLVPYLVPAVARLAPGGPVSWQLAARQLRQNPLASTRAVTGIVVAVTSAIALHSALAAVSFQRESRINPDFPAYSVMIPGTLTMADLPRLTAAYARLDGVRAGTTGYYTMLGDGDQRYGDLVIGDCAALRIIAALDRCADGDTFVIGDPLGAPRGAITVEGREGDRVAWTVPDGPRPVQGLRDYYSSQSELLVTPGAAAGLTGRTPRWVDTSIALEPGSPPDTGRRVRAVAAGIDPFAQVTAFVPEEAEDRWAAVRTAVNLGSTLVLLLMGLGLLLDVGDRLHDRRRLLGVLAAIGARRRTVVRSVLLQVMVPLLTGLVPAVAAGAGLGVALMKAAMIPIHLDAAAIMGPAGVGVGLVLLATAAVLLPLVRHVMRTEELRYE